MAGAVVLNGTNYLSSINPYHGFGSTESHSYIGWLYLLSNAEDTTAIIKNMDASGAVNKGTGVAFYFPSAGTHQLNFYVGNGLGLYTVNPTWVLNAWNQWVITYDGNIKEVRFYRNASLVGSPMTVTQTWAGGTVDNLFLGSGISILRLNARVDETRVHDKVLSLSEIQAHYNSGLGQYGSPEPNLVSGWHFDEGSGDTAFDYSGNDHHLHLVGDNFWGDGIDIVPPFISNISVSAGLDSALITWQTDELSDSVVEYGLTAAYGNTEQNLTDTLNHSISITGLIPNTVYHYKITSSDPSGNSQSTADATFQTNTQGRGGYGTSFWYR